MNLLSHLWNRLSPSTSRRRSSCLLAPALVCGLESRELLAATLGDITATALPARVGDLVWLSDQIPISDPRGFATNGTSTVVVGNDSGMGVIVELTPSGSAAAVGNFQVLRATVNSGDTNRSINLGVAVVNGELIPFGIARDFDDTDSPTYWFNPETPIAADQRTFFGTGMVLSISPAGVMVGGLGGAAGTGVIGNPEPVVPMSLVPGTPAISILSSLTGDSRLLCGTILVWRAEGGGLSIIDTTQWEVPPEILELPDLFFEAVVYEGQHYVAADCTTPDFRNVVGVWHAETGELVALTEVEDQLVDFQEVDGHVALIVNGASGAAVYLDQNFGSRTELSDRLGTTATAEKRTGLNAGGLGMVLEINGIHRAAVFEILTEPDPQTVESAVHQGNYAANVLSLGVRTFEVGLKGSTTFDVTKIDRTTLFIGDERNTVSGKITSIRFTDENQDGFKDAIIKVQTSTALRADTSRLKITGRTTTGDAFDGSRTVTMTAQSWQAHWQATSGTTWRTAYSLFSRGLKRTWW